MQILVSDTTYAAFEKRLREVEAPVEWLLVLPTGELGGIGRHDRNTDLFLDNLRRYRAGKPLRHEVTLDDPPGERGVPAWWTGAS